MRAVDFLYNMKKVIILSVLFLLFLELNAQQEQNGNLTQFLFPGFTKSIVKMKAGRDITLMLNYNIVTEKMVFLQNDQVFDLLNPEAVDTIILNSKLFIPRGKVFYEVLVKGKIDFFIQHKGDILEPGRPAAYGGTSQVSNSTYITRITMGNGTGVYNRKLPDELSIEPDPLYWININDTEYGFENERQFLKIFREDKPEIKKFMKDNRLKFENTTDLIRLVNYCSELIK